MTDEAGTYTDIEVTDGQMDKFFSGEDAGLPEPEAEPQPEPVEAEAQAEPEQKAEPQAETEEREKFVPHGALHEERMRRKELQQQLEETRLRTQRMEETWQKLQERIAEQQKVSYEDDPIEYIRQENEALKQKLSQYDSRFQEQDQREVQAQQFQQFVGAYQAQTQEYAQQVPEFSDAYNYLLSTRANELQAIGYTGEQLKQVLMQEEAMVVDKAFQDGVNPAERIHALAKARGYAKQEQKPPENPEAAKMEALQKGSEASKTLSSGSSKPELTLETLADLDDEEFDKAWEKMVG